MTQTTVAVIDYGMGNLHSVGKAIEKVAPEAKLIITNDHDTILNATHVLLPGVGAMRDCMGEMVKFNVDKIVHEVIEKGTPFLGICVGMQLMCNYSEEGDVQCLGIIDAENQGIKSHGFHYLPIYCLHLKCNKVKGSAKPKLNEISNVAFKVDAVAFWN